MKKINFLKKIKEQGKLELVEPSNEMQDSYLKKADNCFRSAKILSQNNLYENSMSEAYYCMYNSLLALLFKIGIKSENHSASIILFENLFNKEDLTKIISSAKTERIDKQYYVESNQVSKATKESCDEMINNAESFFLKIKVLIDKITNKDIIQIREEINKLINGWKLNEEK